MHSNRLPGSKYMHCLQECNSNPHFGHCPLPVAFCNTVPHCVHRDTARVPGRFTGRGPKVLSRFGGGAPDRSPDPLRDSSRSRSWYPCCRYLATRPPQARGPYCPPASRKAQAPRSHAGTKASCSRQHSSREARTYSSIPRRRGRAPGGCPLTDCRPSVPGSWPLVTENPHFTARMRS